ncbi:MAG: hypothetical protein CVV27_05350 [Candidatus Melainabacteria bacterium HGW-Melainabacteria-1]|nr:MAG: hypothetical protein CVV27_05350 [Candidatus Melainabacteria bacterium HGW-Melainabacteria-1]
MRALLCLLLLLAGCRQPAPIDYRLHTVATGSLELTVPQTGELGSLREITVSAPFDGTLSQLKAEGSVVKAGEVLGQIETTSQAQQRNNAGLSLTEARLDLRLAELDGRRRRLDNQAKQAVADADAQIESLRLRQLQSERDPVALTQLKESLRALAQQMEIHELEARERSRLFDLGYLSRQERDQAQLQLAEATEQQLQLEAELAVLQAGPRKQELAQQALSLQRVRDEQRRVKQELGAQQRVAEVQQRAANARIKRFEQRQAYYQTLISSGVLRAPAAGTLVYGKLTVGDEQIAIKSGDALQEGLQIVRLVDLQQPVVRMMVHEIDAPRIKVGQAVRLTFDTWPETAYAGKVTKLLPVARQTLSEDEQEVRAFSCEVQMLKPDPRLRPGMTALAEIITERFEKALLVPTQAIQGAGNDSWCWVMGPTGPERRRLRPGPSDARMTLVHSGLKAGEQVLLNPEAMPSSEGILAAPAGQPSAVASAQPTGKAVAP